MHNEPESLDIRGPNKSIWHLSCSYPFLIMDMDTATNMVQ